MYQYYCSDLFNLLYDGEKATAKIESQELPSAKWSASFFLGVRILAIQWGNEKPWEGANGYEKRQHPPERKIRTDCDGSVPVLQHRAEKAPADQRESLVLPGWATEGRFTQMERVYVRLQIIDRLSDEW